MNARQRSVAAAQLLLISPAILFMGALGVRSLQPLQKEPAHTAQQIVMWYAVRQWTLWVLLIALPLTVLLTGCITLARTRSEHVRLATQQTLAGIRTNRGMLLIAATTLTAAVVLAIVGLHMLAD